MDEAKGKLLRLAQRRKIRKYVKNFNDLALQVDDLWGKRGFFAFMDGLKP